MRILHVLSSIDGGSGSILRDSAAALADAGIDQMVVLPGGNRVADDLRSSGVVLAQAPFDKAKRNATRSIIKRAARDFGPDIVHYWSGKAAGFATHDMAARSIGWYGRYHKLSRFKRCRWHIAADAEIARNILTQGAPADRVGVLAGYAEIAHAPPASRASFATPEGAAVAFAPGRLGRHATAALVQATAQLPDLYVWICEESAADVLEAADGVGVADRIRVVCGEARHGGALAACDVVTFPSLRPDPAALIQAWAAERPAIIAEGARTQGAWGERPTGLYVLKGDPAALRSAIRRVLEDAALVRRLKENGRRAYETTFTKPAFIRTAMRLYDRVKTRQSVAAR